MRKKILFFVLLIFILSALSFGAFGCGDNTTENIGEIDKTSENSEKDFLFEITNDEVTVTGIYDKNVKNIDLPEKILGKKVTSISNYAFMGCKYLTSVNIPNCVKSIGYGAFSGAERLSDITLPFVGDIDRTSTGKNLYTFGYIFGEKPYDGGTMITQYYYRDTLNSVYSADYCLPISLKKVRINGKGNTHIPYSAFRNCTMIDRIVLGGGVSSVGTFAFLGATAEIVWDNPKMDKIDEYSMSDYKGTAFTIPSSVKTICRAGLADCEFMKKIVIPDNVTTIEPYAFRGCFRAESLKLSKNVKKIGINTFYFCTGLKSAELFEGLEEIGETAFMGCKALEKIVIPKTVKYIYIGAFKNCDNLKNIIISGDSDWISYNSVSSGIKLSAKTLSNPATAAFYLTDRYSDYIWERL